MLSTALAAAAAMGAAGRPNIVFVMADDMGWGEVGLFPAGSAHGRIATPNLDRLGREGMVFTDAYAGYTVCAPSRTTLFTGRHSGQFPKYGLSGTEIRPGQNVTTTAELLQRAGYTTGVSGKVAPLMSPTTQGFDHFFGQISQLDCHNMYPGEVDTQVGSAAPTKVKLPLNQKAKGRDECMAHPEAYNYTTDLFHNDAMSWLEDVAGGAKPFFLYLAFTVPHAGGWSDNGAESGAPVPTDAQYADENWPNVEKDHAGTIVYMDKLVGQLLDKLDALGVDNDTVLFFASDNGAHLEGGHSYKFFNSTGGLLGHKRSLYEGGVRSPSMVRWPGTVAPGQTSSLQWAFWDVMPTFAELAGVPERLLPEGIDGMSIAPTLLGNATQPTHDYMYFTWPGANPSLEGANKIAGYGVRMGDWKGVVPHCGSDNKPSSADVPNMQLYNLATDPHETTDVSSQNRAQVEKMVQFVMTKNLTCECYQC